MGRRNQGNKLDPEEASPEKAAAGWRAGVASGRPGRQAQAPAAVRRAVARLPSAWAWASGQREGEKRASVACWSWVGLGLEFRK